MKRFFLMVIVAAMAVSCLNDGNTFEGTYNPTATFDYSDLTQVLGADSVYYDGPAYRGTDFLAMINAQNKDAEPFKGGFALSMKHDSIDVAKYIASDSKRTLHPMSVYAKGGAGRSRGFSVFYQNEDSSIMPKEHMVFLSSEIGEHTMSVCMIANTALTVANVLDPSSKYYFARNESGEGKDYLKLVATGYNNGAKTGTAEYYLVDFRGKTDSLLKGWKRFNISKLGDIDYVNFELESSIADLPKYFCIDNIFTNVHIKY